MRVRHGAVLTLTLVSFLLPVGTRDALALEAKTPGAYAVELATNRLYTGRKVTDDARHLAKSYRKNKGEAYSKAQFEKFYGSDMREVGNSILDLAILVWLEPEESVLKALTDWCGWAIKKESWGKNHDLEMSHLLFALAVTYDWHSARMEYRQKEELKAFLYSRAKFQYEAAVSKKAPYWATSYGHNHCWINHTSILAAGIVLNNEYAETLDWVNYSKGVFEKILRLLPVDGTNHESLNYSVYGTLWLVRALAILERDEPGIFNKNTYFKEYARYFEAMRVDAVNQRFFDLGDSPQYLWYQPGEIFAKLYTEFGNSAYGDLFSEYQKPVPAGHKGSKRNLGLMSAVYGLPKVKEKNEPLDRDLPFVSTDMGLWIDKKYAGRDLESTLLFKSGVPGGRVFQRYVKENEGIQFNVSHNHPDQNHFMVWTRQGYLISDTGNVVKKLTRDHNALLIDGFGQSGEGERWFKSGRFAKQKFMDQDGLNAKNWFSDQGLAIVKADAAAFYPSDLGLRKFERTVVWLKEGFVFVFDNVLLEKDAELTLRFHSDFKLKERAVGVFDFRGAGSHASIMSLCPPDARIEVLPVEAEMVSKDKDQHQGEVLQLRLFVKGETFRNPSFLTAITLPRGDATPLNFKQNDGKSSVSLTASGRQIEVLFPVVPGESMRWSDYEIKAGAAVAVRNDDNGGGRIFLFGGEQISRNGDVQWSLPEAEHRWIQLRTDGSLLIEKTEIQEMF